MKTDVDERLFIFWQRVYEKYYQWEEFQSFMYLLLNKCSK